VRKRVFGSDSRDFAVTWCSRNVRWSRSSAQSMWPRNSARSHSGRADAPETTDQNAASREARDRNAALAASSASRNRRSPSPSHLSSPADQLLDAGQPDPIPLGRHRLAHAGPIGRHQRLDLGRSQTLVQRARPVTFLCRGGTGRNLADRHIQSAYKRLMQGYYLRQRVRIRDQTGRSVPFIPQSPPSPGFLGSFARTWRASQSSTGASPATTSRCIAATTTAIQ
jgi:hypothetical protein